MKTHTNFECALGGETTGMSDADINYPEKQDPTPCKHERRYLVESGGDAESGPITITACKDYGKTFTTLGM